MTAPALLLHLEQKESLAVGRSIPVGARAGAADKVTFKQDSGGTHSQGGADGDLRRHPLVPISVKQLLALVRPDHLNPSIPGDLVHGLGPGEGSDHSLTSARLFGGVGYPVPIR